jgi:PAS domain S-box-containing protein
MVRRDGTQIWVREESAVTRSGTRVVAEGVFTDVTARRIAQDALREAETRFRNLVEQIPAITFIEDPDTGGTIYISPQIEELTGYTPQEWIDDPDLWTRCLHPDDRDRIVAENDADIGDRWSVDYRSITRDGRTIWLHNETVLIREDDGHPLYWQGVVSDITERKEAEERLRDAEERYRALVEQLPVAVYTDAVDEMSSALYISPRYEQLTGYSPRERLADPGLWVRMLHPDDRDRVLRESERTNATGDPFDIEYRIVAADGRTLWLHDHAVLVHDPEGRPIWQGVLQDVTERRVAQDALARRDAILQATGFAAERFLGSDSWASALPDVLERLADAGGADRAYLYRNETDDDGTLRVSIVGSWDRDPADRADRRDVTTSFPWCDGGFERWVDVLGAGQVLHGEVATFPASERRVLERAGIVSVFAAPVFVRGAWWGYIGFDDLDQVRVRHDVEVEALTVTANTLGAAIARDLAASELAATQRRYQTLVEQIPAMTYIQRATDGAILYYSPQAYDVLGYEPDEWGGFEYWEAAIHPDDRERVLEEDRLTNESGAPFHLEYRLLAKDGRTVWIRDDALLIRDDDGAPLYWQGVRFDITEHKEAEERLRSAEERYRGIVEHVPAAIYLDRCDRSLRSLYVSPQIEQIAGVTPQAWLEQPDLWTDMIDPADRDRVLRGYVEAADRGLAWTDEYRMRTGDGRTVWVHDETTILHDEAGRPSMIQGVIFDVTERMLAEQALRESERREREAADRLRALDDMKNTFLAAVSHELRSPLTSILGLSLTLERAAEMHDEDRGDLLQRLAANARKLDRLLKDLLDIDRLNRGIVEPQLRTVDVGLLARHTVESLDALAGRDVVTRTESVEVAVDPAKVERIVENLLINASRHTPADGRIWLTVGPHGGGVLITVQDEGPGIPAELRAAIFEPFRQGPTESPHSPGTGIGLSLVARFAELHGGRAWVDERPGGGASFHVLLPDGAEAAHGSRAGEVRPGEVPALQSATEQPSVTMRVR